MSTPVADSSSATSCSYRHHHHDHNIHEHSHENSLHDTHTHSVDAWLAEAENQCTLRGTRWTPLRSEVLRLILEAGRPIGAYDLLARMAHHGRAPAPPTVYRTLDFLLEQGFIHRLTSINAFVSCCHPRSNHDAAFLICQRCHRVDEAESSNLKHLLHDLATQGHFTPTQTIIEIAGLCEECRNQGHDAAPATSAALSAKSTGKAARSSKA